MEAAAAAVVRLAVWSGEERGTVSGVDGLRGGAGGDGTSRDNDVDGGVARVEWVEGNGGDDAVFALDPVTAAGEMA